MWGIGHGEFVVCYLLFVICYLLFVIYPDSFILTTIGRLGNASRETIFALVFAMPDKLPAILNCNAAQKIPSQTLTAVFRVNRLFLSIIPQKVLPKFQRAIEMRRANLDPSGIAVCRYIRHPSRCQKSLYTLKSRKRLSRI